MTTILSALSFFLIYYIVHRVFIWQNSLLYQVLNRIEYFFPILIPIFLVLLIVAISYFYLGKTIGFIEEIAEASQSLIVPDDEEIRLPEELREIEYSMNQIKRTALRNEREARQAEQRKNDLVVNLAHDIRTPLSSVIGYLNLLDEAADLPPDQRIKYVRITLEKTYRLEQLIDEFFEITRFNLSSIVLNEGKIKLSFMLEQLSDEFYPMMAPQRKQALVQVPEEVYLWGDADKLSRVFNNILKNAITYSYEDSTIEIKVFSMDDQIMIQFLNQGDPIPLHQLETIFERFFRLDASRSSSTGGSGLGLAIAKEIVEAHGGRITAQSDEKETIFSVTLPNKIKEMNKPI